MECKVGITLAVQFLYTWIFSILVRKFYASFTIRQYFILTFLDADKTYDMKCPKCSNDDIGYKDILNSSISDPILCDSCHSLLIQYRFISIIGQSISALSFVLSFLLLIFDLWGYALLFFGITIASYLSTRFGEIKYTRLKVLDSNKSRFIQAAYTSLGIAIGLLIFLLLLQILPNDNEILNMSILDYF
jgi:hypothetical protein